MARLLDLPQPRPFGHRNAARVTRGPRDGGAVIRSAPVSTADVRSPAPKLRWSIVPMRSPAALRISSTLAMTSRISTAISASCSAWRAAGSSAARHPYGSAPGGDATCDPRRPVARQNGSLDTARTAHPVEEPEIRRNRRYCHRRHRWPRGPRRHARLLRHGRRRRPSPTTDPCPRRCPASAACSSASPATPSCWSSSTTR